MTGPREIFDRTLLLERRRRLARRLGEAGVDVLPDFLLGHAGSDVVDRLGMISRRFERAVVIGSYHGPVARALEARGVASVVEVEPVAELLDLSAGRDRVDSV